MPDDSTPISTPTPDPAARWNEEYASGKFQKRWDYQQPSQELVAVLASRLVPPGTAVLDIGCGAGNEAIFLAQLGYRVIGVDLSAKALEIAKERGAKAGVTVDWRQGSALSLPLDDRSVAFVNDRGCFHLVGPADRPKYVAEVTRVLLPGGRILLRGARPEEAGEGFTPVTTEAVDKVFPATTFARGPVLPITLISDAGTLKANVVVLQKRS